MEQIVLIILDLIKSITNNSGNYNEKYMKIEFNLNDVIPLKKKGCKVIDVNKTSASKKCIICHYWYFLDKVFKFQPDV